MLLVLLSPLGLLPSCGKPPPRRATWRAGAAVCQEQRTEVDSVSFRQRLKEVPIDRALLAELSGFYRVWHPRGRKGRSSGRPLDEFRWGAKPKFLASAATPASLPPEGLPEVALIGRSNVGKSSLLNALMGTPGAARVSDKPGKTQQLAFFSVGVRAEEFLLVDMPGYGFAMAGDRDVARWQDLCTHYLQKRKSLKMVVVLADGRTGLKHSDLQMLQFLEAAAVKYTVVLTKVDVAGTPERIAQVMGVSQQATRGASRRLQKPLAYVSSRFGTGVPELRRRISDAAHGRAPPPPPPPAGMAAARGGGRTGRGARGRGLGATGQRGAGRGRGQASAARGAGRGGRGTRGARGRQPARAR